MQNTPNPYQYVTITCLTFQILIDLVRMTTKLKLSARDISNRSCIRFFGALFFAAAGAVTTAYFCRPVTDLSEIDRGSTGCLALSSHTLRNDMSKFDSSLRPLEWWELPEAANRYGVVFFEPRFHAALVWLVLDTLEKLPPTWRGLVFYSEDNERLVRAGLGAWGVELGGRLSFAPFPPGGDSRSKHFANFQLLSPAFYDVIPFEKFLLVQVNKDAPF